jgi:hypothetical protein
MQKQASGSGSGQDVPHTVNFALSWSSEWIKNILLKKSGFSGAY